MKPVGYRADHSSVDLYVQRNLRNPSERAIWKERLQQAVAYLTALQRGGGSTERESSEDEESD